MTRETGRFHPTRRWLLQSGLAAGGALLARPAFALAPTPSQTLGPFYPDKLPLDSDNDLIVVGGSKTRPAGVLAHLFGRVVAEDGRPVPGARVEIWQCDNAGVYHHPRAGGTADPNFQGYGQTTTAADGAYRFRTIRPVSYPGRAPHIHMAVSGPGFARLVTQMYVAGEPRNETDFLLRSVRDETQRQSLIVAFAPAPDIEPDSIKGHFEIVIGRALFGG